MTAGDALVEHRALLYALAVLRRGDRSRVLISLAHHPNSRVKSFGVARRACELIAETIPVVGGERFSVDDAIDEIDEQRQTLEARFPSLAVPGAW